jgi:hypothetical protein
VEQSLEDDMLRRLQVKIDGENQRRDYDLSIQDDEAQKWNTYATGWSLWSADTQIRSVADNIYPRSREQVSSPNLRNEPKTSVSMRFLSLEFRALVASSSAALKKDHPTGSRQPIQDSQDGVAITLILIQAHLPPAAAQSFE